MRHGSRSWTGLAAGWIKEESKTEVRLEADWRRACASFQRRASATARVSWLVAYSSALFFWLSSHSHCLSIQYLVVSTRSPFPWTCDGAWDKEKHNPTTCGVSEQLSQGSPRSSSTDHGAKTVGPGTRTTSFRVVTARVAERQLRAVPDVPEERVDLLQVSCLNL